MNKYKTLDLTIIGDKKCSTTRTYLEYLHQHGFKPAHLLLVDFLYTPVFKNRFDKLLYNIHRDLYKKIHKPVKGLNLDPFFVELCKRFQDPFDLHVDLYSDDFPFERYVDKIHFLKAWDYNDFSFQKFLINLGHKYFLYTNGGIVPRALLEQENFKVLHIHPGLVPFIRGSDGLLWSILMRNKIGVSCFFMAPGIDTGDLIEQQEFEFHHFLDLKALLPDHLDILYKALLYAYDPHFRAKILLKALLNVNGDLNNLKGIPQSRKGQRSYYSMHPSLVHKVFSTYICEKTNA